MTVSPRCSVGSSCHEELRSPSPMPAFTRSDLPELHIFVAIVRRRSFKQAAIELGLTTSALSHAMNKLENRIGVRLLHRTNRTVVPTPIGEKLAERLELGFQTIGDALADVQAYRQKPSGELRINLPKDAARLLVAPVLADFTAAHPLVHLVLSVEDRPVDIVAEGFDVGIRYGGTVPRGHGSVGADRSLTLGGGRIAGLSCPMWSPGTAGRPHAPCLHSRPLRRQLDFQMGTWRRRCDGTRSTCRVRLPSTKPRRRSTLPSKASAWAMCLERRALRGSGRGRWKS